MTRTQKLVAGGAALLAVVLAGGAIAATNALSPREERQAILNDAASRLGVEPSELSDALKEALKNRVDEAVDDGRLTEAQGARFKQRIDAGEAPLFGLGPRPGFGFRHHRGPAFFHAKLDTAARYLGLSRAELRQALQRGQKTLAQVARDRGKSVDGLVDAMLAAAERKLEAAVERGDLTDAERDDALSGLRERITDLVNGRPGRRFHDRRPRTEFFPEARPFVF